jgi:hypothetical protein
LSLLPIHCLFFSQTSLRRELDETNAKIGKVSHEFEDFKEKLNERVDETNAKVKYKIIDFYSVFQGFSKAKFAYNGSILSSRQFLILPQLPQKMKLKSKVVIIDPKIIVSLPTI